MKTKIKNKYKLVIDEKLRQKYLEEYFEKHPKRRVEPVGLFFPTLNKVLVSHRMWVNSEKGKYKEYACWMAEYFNIKDLHMEFAEIEYTFYFEDKIRRDIDNLVITPKFLHDGFVDAGVFIDDDSKHLGMNINRTKYDKENPRIEIIIKEVAEL